MGSFLPINEVKCGEARQNNHRHYCLADETVASADVMRLHFVETKIETFRKGGPGSCARLCVGEATSPRARAKSESVKGRYEHGNSDCHRKLFV